MSYVTYQGKMIQANGKYARFIPPIIPIDPSFNVGTGFNASLFRGNAVLVENSQEKLYIGGQFTAYNNSSTNYITSLNANGTINTDFSTGTGFNTNSGGNSQTYYDSLTQKIFVGGSFRIYKGSTTDASMLVKLNLDGSQDNTFHTGTGFNSAVMTIATDTTGKVYCGGIFTSYDNSTANRIIGLNSDGTRNTSFAISTGLDAYPTIMKVDSNGKLYVFGSFTTYKGVSENRGIRLNNNGTKDTGFNIGTGFTGFNGYPYGMDFDSDGKLYIGGGFTGYNGVTVNRIVKLNTDGSQDVSFDPSNGFNNVVNAVKVDPISGKIYVGGTFTTYRGISVNRLVRLNTDGTIDTNFDSSTGFNNDITGININSFGNIYVSGYFTLFKGATQNRIVKLDPSGNKM